MSSPRRPSFSSSSGASAAPRVRVLLLGDTHIGFDLPLRPRVQRRRRGTDFLRNLERALEPARHGEVDLVVHGGDLLDRPVVPEPLVTAAVEPLLEVARRGVPVLIVPGNHDGGRIVLPLLARHPNLHVFDRPDTLSHQPLTAGCKPCPWTIETDASLLRLRPAREGLHVTMLDGTYLAGRGRRLISLPYKGNVQMVIVAGKGCGPPGG